ncbi:PLP-dependent aminotransferase family protein [Sulfuricurvum sp.]|uniref:MocR-like pyridoxine biosynthesis transcription factor PdxR n=1 Tax=Sulfuricurvum sp. TaxID=2025608 RepID=UPI002D6DB9C4|nr:PLP-dependent aminotransferase family protein [Sulfuricurvum sp.]HZF71431.1 PLP-dependent aminotransferase family protein [Sulfuricurvum sp.]
MYLLDATSDIPLHIQLYEALKHDITTTLAIGSKLPSIRKISQEYRISKNTVESAYNQLYAEGYIESRPKSGYYVADADFNPLGKPLRIESTDTPAITYCYNFYPVRLSKEIFPLKLWKRLYNRAIDDTLDFGAYSDPQGEFGLRAEIARYLTELRGVRCDASQIIVTGAFIDAMSMVADILHPTHQHFAIEHPGYHIARKVFAHRHYDITPIGVDENGLLIDELSASDARVVYITPSHQYPTGAAMPITNRLQLLAWAKENDGYIIEDDYDSELTYRSRPIPSLQGLDSSERVIYIGTFAKALSPALRVGYIVLPHHLMDRYRSFHGTFSRVSLMTQKTLELFMREGHWERHLRRVRNLNRKKHDMMKQALIKYLGDSILILSEGSGLSINIRPAIDIDYDLLRKYAEEAGIKLHFAKDYSGGEWDAIRMGFGGFEMEEIEPAVKAFAEIVLRKTV